MNIRIANQKTLSVKQGEVVVYIDRRSPVGNPFYMHSEAERDTVCDKYAEYFAQKVAEKTDTAFMDYLRNIWKLAQQHDVVLVCWCAPKRCHGETIKQFIESFSK